MHTCKACSMTLRTATPKPKVCKVCRASFTPTKPMQKVCDWGCAVELAIRDRVKADKREIKKALEKLKSRSDWAREAQAAVNQFIRLRDADLPCISCQRHHQGQYHAGHFLSVGARPELRFVESNIHKQCSACNNYLAGNVVLYRKWLIEKIGTVGVEWLEGNHPTRKYTIDDLKAIKTEYAAKVRELKRGQE